jgi:hypothetical protein
MAKTFYTEIDVEDLFKRGVTSLEISDQVVLTELAYEKANRLGMSLLKGGAQPPAAPIRPYIAKESSPAAGVQTPILSTEGTTPQDLTQRIKTAVTARLGTTIDPALLDAIIRRVLDQVRKG